MLLVFSEITNREIVILFFVLGCLLLILLIIASIFVIKYFANSNKRMLQMIIKGIKVDPKTAELIALAESFWRLEKNILESGELNLEKPKIVRNLDRIKRFFKSVNIDYFDYSNRPYNGLNVEVISITSKKGVKHPYISTTYKPEIRFNGAIVQKSQVDVCQPKVLERFSIIYESNGGNLVSSSAHDEDTEIGSPNSPIKDGYIFEGWFDAETRQPVVFPFVLVKNMKLEAKWIEIQPNASFPVDDNHKSIEKADVENKGAIEVTSDIVNGNLTSSIEKNKTGGNQNEAK